MRAAVATEPCTATSVGGEIDRLKSPAAVRITTPTFVLALSEPLVPTTANRKLPTVAAEVAESVSVPDVIPSAGGVRVPGPLKVTPAGPDPTHVTVVLTGDEKPLMEAIMIFTDPLPACERDTVPAEAESEKLG